MSTFHTASFASFASFAEGRWKLPVLDEVGFHGIAGEWAREIQPYTEANPVGVLLSSLVSFGSAAGRSAFTETGATRHHLNENVLLVGLTASGRKGEAMDAGLRPLKLADPGWAPRVCGGFGSGEAVVSEVSDSEESEVSEGTRDKRLLVNEGEFAHVLTVAGRDGSTLSSLIRNAWDGKRLESRTKGRKLVATDALVSVLAGITPGELVQRMSAVDVSNGFLNRFLIAAVAREKLLASPQPIPAALEQRYAAKFAKALGHARRQGRLERDPGDQRVEALWTEAYEGKLSVDRPGMMGMVCSRAEAHALRLSMLFAMLDCADKIGVVHVEAALAVWDYCEQSARLVFGDATGDPDADKLLAKLVEVPDGLDRTQISGLFDRHRSKAQLDELLRRLVQSNRIYGTRRKTGGRPVEVYVHEKHAQEIVEDQITKVTQ